MKRMLTLALAVTGAAVFAAPAMAGTIHVAAGGSIQTAVNAAADGDTIVVSHATFHENVTVSGKTNLAIVARGATLEAANDTQAALTIQGSSDVRVSGFRIEGGAAGGVDVAGSSDVHLFRNNVTARGPGIVAQMSSDLRFDHNVVAALAGPSISVQGSMQGNSSVVVVLANRVTGSVSSGIAVDARGDAQALVTVQGNAVIASSTNGIEVALDASGQGAAVVGNRISASLQDGVQVTGGVDGKITGNAIFQSGDNGIQVAADSELIARNRIVGSGGDALVTMTSNSTIQGNAVANTQGNGIVVGGSDNTVSSNQVQGSADAAVQVSGSSNVFVGNTTDNSVTVQDTGSANVFVDGGIRRMRR